MFGIFGNKNKKEKKLEKFFNPSSVAVVGATPKSGKVGNVIAKNLLELGYSGKVFLVNPRHDELFGRKCYKSLEEIEDVVDLAIVAIPADFVVDTVANSSGKIKNFAIVSAGFSEIGQVGKEREERLKIIAKENGLNILGPNCLGFINPEIKLNASFAGGMPQAGNVAFISQSGALAVALMDIAEKENIKFSNLVSVGNKMQMSEAELIEYFGEDKNVDVIGLYLEGINDGEKFVEVARRVSAKKPIIILKAGKTDRAQKAISSHTGALAGSDAIINEAFVKAGVIRAENLENFFDLIEVISKSSAVKNENVIVVTNAGGPGVLTTDAFENKKIKLAEIENKTKEKLMEFLPSESSVENPIDLLGDADEIRYSKTLEACNDAKAGSILCLLTPQDQTPVEKIAEKIIDFKKQTDKNVLVAFIGGEKIEQALKILQENEIPNVPFPDRAVAALDKYYKWGKNKKSPDNIIGMKKKESRAKKVKEIILKAKNSGRTALLFSETVEIMKLYGINMVDFANAKDGILGGLNFGFPMVAKVDSDKTLHKTDKEGLILGINNQEELEKGIEKLRVNFPGENLIIQPMQNIKMELIVGIKRDETFGPVVVYGLGGIYTEIFKQVNFLIVPMNKEEIRRHLLASNIGFLFRSTRGQKPFDAGEMVDILHSVMELAQESESILEFDINPLLVYNDKKSVAVDVKIII
ncbi:MAG: Acetyl-CoA synthetase (ADP-forming), alpha and beta subunit fusion [Candidatus Moranbacteria bacterium GW2011_GWE2_35_2-]|nr:MAG: Acetyl-CoA synthetase (ADP-forming), alpha and beta subunit fusion [Candidatus Moranbacteria bacterium GW2011_GWE2_35_2-]KKQ06034.1 MAG: Acetyl-CoA synthetase (ADP-forming), alpha and beta subunit fusion [Candidatus Moranbacteria bacterium GW2011_GWF1_36_4]KKQ22377.1 MAG: Acetyl-CoA synthetase (ADP-forming), alpha and beta subunit fusion [Candidatus Moranbacteria bacterium GW2011_GWF2_37_11]KKQ29445.1 MAG: Acetyl-CoA synthetase (ADP-forming), alpha and beta subunit fusion [Candidatus Mor